MMYIKFSVIYRDENTVFVFVCVKFSAVLTSEIVAIQIARPAISFD